MGASFTGVTVMFTVKFVSVPPYASCTVYTNESASLLS